MNFNVCAVWATGKEKNSLLNYATFEGDIFMGKKNWLSGYCNIGKWKNINFGFELKRFGSNQAKTQILKYEGKGIRKGRFINLMCIKLGKWY